MAEEEAVWRGTRDEEYQSTGGEVPIRRDVIERGGTHEVLCGAGDPD